jgi:hypothetical protein
LLDDKVWAKQSALLDHEGLSLSTIPNGDTPFVVTRQAREFSFRGASLHLVKLIIIIGITTFTTCFVTAASTEVRNLDWFRDDCIL